MIDTTIEPQSRRKKITRHPAFEPYPKVFVRLYDSSNIKRKFTVIFGDLDDTVDS